LKILVVDDSKSVHNFVKICLNDANVELEFANDGVEALERAATGGIDLILLDWEMPNKNGIDTLIELRGAGNETPVIMLTSRNDPEDIAKAIQNGAQDYIMKPFPQDILTQKLEMLMGLEI